MANIKPFDPGALPNRLVGTPGVDQSAGAAAESLAKEAARIRDQVAQTANGAGEFWGQLAGKAGGEIGHLLTLQANATAKQNQQLAHANAVKLVNQYSDNMNQEYVAMKAKYAGNPMQMEPEFQKLQDKQKQYWLNHPDYQQAMSDPVLRAQTENQIDENANMRSANQREWALTTQTAQVHAMPKLQISTAVDRLINLPVGADMVDRISAMRNERESAAAVITKLQDQLGPAVVQQHLTDLDNSLSKALIASAIHHKTVADPEKALLELSGVRAVLENGHELGLKFKEGDFKELSNELHSEETKWQGLLENDTLSGQISTTNDAEHFKNRVKNSAATDLPSLAQEADQHLSEIDARTKQIEKDPRYTEEARHVLLKGQEANYHQWRIAKDSIDSRQNDLKRENNEEGRLNAQLLSAQLQDNAAERQLLQGQKTEAKQAEDKALAEARLSAQTSIKADLQQLQNALTGPPAEVVARRSDLMRMAARVSIKAHTMSTIDKTLSAAEAGHYTQQMSGLMKQIALLKHDDGVMGIGAGDRQLSTKVPDKIDVLAGVKTAVGLKPEYQEAAEAQVRALQELKVTADRMRLEKGYGDLTADAGFDMAQRTRWNAGVTQLQAEAQTKKYSALQFEFKLQQLHAAIAGEPQSKQLERQIMKLEQEKKDLVGAKLDHAQQNVAASGAQPWQSAYAKPGPYTTTLSPAEEQNFQSWIQKNKIPFDNSGTSDYDMRGYWKDVVSKGKDKTQVNKNDHQVHFPDTYKTPYHRSFSRESRYATADAPRWINDHQLADKHGRIVFDEQPHRAPTKSGFVPPPPAGPGITGEPEAWRMQVQGVPLQILEEELARRKADGRR